jgi:hypothetical protein
MAPDFLLVSDNIARNPICRAVARHNLQAAVRDFSIRLRMLADGEDARLDGLAAARTLAVAIRVLDQRDLGDTPDARVMRGGMECLVQLAGRKWKWRASDAAAVDVALDRAQGVYRTATAREQHSAYRYVMDLEMEPKQ